MKKFVIQKEIYFLISCILFSGNIFSQQSNQYKLWYTQPANQFEEALPLGNGRLGIMVYGGVKTERFSLNEETLWAGGPVNPDMNPNAKNYLQPVREALFNEDYKKADSLVRFMQGKYSESYAPLGSLFFDFNHKGEPTDYRRELDIQNAVSKTTYHINGTDYTRETFVSYPDQVAVIRITAKGADKLDFSCRFTSQLQHYTLLDGDRLRMKGYAPIHAEPNYRGKIPDAIIYDSANAMRFSSLLKIIKTDGLQSFQDSTLKISNATEAILLLSIATSYNGFDKNPGTEGKNEVKSAEEYLQKAASKAYAALLKNHTTDFRKYFDRVYIDLGDREAESLNTIDRLNRFAAGKTDNSLIALYYQYSRYLLISSSRPGGIPANLQGIWNEQMRPPWSSNFTTNINAEMNYWGAEAGNLSEMHQPLLDFIGRLAKTGTITARNYYNADGWTCHHNSDIWAMTNPVGAFGEGSPCWANWPMGGAWMATHLWEHYAFTNNKTYLKDQAYPLLKGAVQFCLDFLTPDKKGNLVTAPSTSPENVYITTAGYKGQTLYGGTADHAMIRELFVDFLKASEELKLDEEIQKKVKSALDKIYPYQVGKKGNLQEWYHDWEDEDPRHRHLSHLFGAYPGYTITTSQTAGLAEAVRKSLEIRTNEGTGWAITWRINLWARMQNGERAYDAIKKMLRFVGNDASIKMGGGGVYANLFGAHPPFQIDGNFGGGAGISEMLLQSHQGYIDLLPALPVEWKEGEVKGLVARGSFVINMKWKNGKLVAASILSRSGGDCKIKYGSKLITKKTVVGKKYDLVF